MRTVYAVKWARSSQPKERSSANGHTDDPASGAAPTPEQGARAGAAIAHADAGGLEALTMRQLAEMLKVAPMALYRHIANKDDLIDAMIDVVFREIGLPSGGADWKTAMRKRAMSLRDVLARHRWAIGLMESQRRPGPANLRHHDAVIGKLRAAGFNIAMTAHVYSVLDSYIYGFATTKTNLPFDTSAEVAQVAQDMLEPFPANEYRTSSSSSQSMP